MREIFKRKQGKDFYRNALEYMEYDENDFTVDKDDWYSTFEEEDEVIGHKVAKRIGNM